MKKAFPIFYMVFAAAFTPTAHADSISIVFCDANNALITYSVDSVETTPSIKVRDRTVTDNSVKLTTSQGDGVLEGNFAAEWTGSNTNIEAFLLNASAVQSGSAALCPGQ